jgi:hypothetical protein
MAGVSAPSHICPGLALIAELVRRGHRVTYVVGRRHAGLVAPTGAELLTRPTILPGPGEPWPEDTGEAMQVFLDEAIAVAPLLDAVDRPDAVLYDIGGFAGRLRAQAWDVPAVQLSPTWVAWEGLEEERAEQTAALKASPSGRRYFATLHAWLDASGVAVDPDAFIGREDVYRLCLDHLAADHRLVISTGKVDPARLESLPPGAQAARTQPQLDVLRHADVFVTHAGMGGAAESLWYGVPTVALPQAVDQFVNAATLERIGAGVRLDEGELTGARLHQAVREALSRTDRAMELQEEVRAAGGPGVAADAVERLVR